MSNHDNTNRGAIWENTRKRPDKKDPDFTGKLNVEGHEFWVDAWKPGPSTNANAPVLSFRVKRKDSMAPAVDYAKPEPEPSEGGFEDSEIPFAKIDSRLP